MKLLLLLLFIIQISYQRVLKLYSLTLNKSSSTWYFDINESFIWNKSIELKVKWLLIWFISLCVTKTVWLADELPVDGVDAAAAVVDVAEMVLSLRGRCSSVPLWRSRWPGRADASRDQLSPVGYSCASTWFRDTFFIRRLQLQIGFGLKYLQISRIPNSFLIIYYGLETKTTALISFHNSTICIF